MKPERWYVWKPQTTALLVPEHHIILKRHQKSSFVCSLNPIRQTSIPRPYTVISLLSSHHCSSQPSQYLYVSSRAYTRLLNNRIEKQRLSPENVAANREPVLFAQAPGLCEFRIKRKESDWLFCKKVQLSQKVKSWQINFCLMYI